MAKARVGLKNIKRDKFATFCESLRKDSNPSFIWKRISGFKNRWNCPENKHEYSVDKICGVNEQINSLFPPWAPYKPPIFQITGCDPFLDCPFTLMELKEAIASVNIHSAPGLDGVDFKPLCLLPTAAKVVLLNIYNEIFLSQVFPSEWSKYLVFLFQNL